MILANYVHFCGELRPMLAMFDKMLGKWLCSSEIIFITGKKKHFFSFFLHDLYSYAWFVAFVALCERFFTLKLFRNNILTETDLENGYVRPNL